MSWEEKKKKQKKIKSVVRLVVIAPFVHAFVEEDMGLGWWVGEVLLLWRKLTILFILIKSVLES